MGFSAGELGKTCTAGHLKRNLTHSQLGMGPSLFAPFVSQGSAGELLPRGKEGSGLLSSRGSLQCLEMALKSRSDDTVLRTVLCSIERKRRLFQPCKRIWKRKGGAGHQFHLWDDTIEMQHKILVMDMKFNLENLSILYGVLACF